MSSLKGLLGDGERNSGAPVRPDLSGIGISLTTGEDNRVVGPTHDGGRSFRTGLLGGGWRIIAEGNGAGHRLAGSTAVGEEVARGLCLDFVLTDHIGEDLDGRALGLAASQSRDRND